MFWNWDLQRCCGTRRWSRTHLRHQCFTLSPFRLHIDGSRSGEDGFLPGFGFGIVFPPSCWDRSTVSLPPTWLGFWCLFFVLQASVADFMQRCVFSAVINTYKQHQDVRCSCLWIKFSEYVDSTTVLKCRLVYWLLGMLLHYFLDHCRPPVCHAGACSHTEVGFLRRLNVSMSFIP